MSQSRFQQQTRHVMSIQIQTTWQTTKTYKNIIPKISKYKSTQHRILLTAVLATPAAPSESPVPSSQVLGASASPSPARCLAPHKRFGCLGPGNLASSCIPHWRNPIIFPSTSINHRTIGSSLSLLLLFQIMPFQCPFSVLMPFLNLIVHEIALGKTSIRSFNAACSAVASF